MPAPPARADVFPVAPVVPATVKTKMAEWFDYTLALLGASGTAAGVLAALGSGAGWAPIVTGGTATAFTLTPSEASAANAAGQRYRVSFHAAAGATPTLAVSGRPALNLKYKDSTGTKLAITSVQVPINWISDVEADGADWVVLQPASVAQYEIGTFSATISGLVGITSQTLTYVKIGKQVTISFPSFFLEAVSNSTVKRVSGIPANLYPATTLSIPNFVSQNSRTTVQGGRIEWASGGGTLECYSDMANGAWPGSVTTCTVFLSPFTYLTA